MTRTTIDHAMVLAAGMGKRMRPLTETRPKPLVELAGRTLLDRAIDHLEAAGVARIVVNTHYLGDMVAGHLNGRSGFVLSPEELLLETGGGIANALPHLGNGPFFAVNSDSVWSDGQIPALRRLAGVWDESRMDALLLLYPTVSCGGIHDSGDFHMEPDGRLRRRSEGEVAAFVFTGIQILHPRLFDGAPGGPFSLNILYDRAEESERLYGLRHDGEWFHVGTPQELETTAALFNGAPDPREFWIRR